MKTRISMIKQQGVLGRKNTLTISVNILSWATAISAFIIMKGKQSVLLTIFPRPLSIISKTVAWEQTWPRYRIHTVNGMISNIPASDANHADRSVKSSIQV
jgi:hypothetical protein